MENKTLKLNNYRLNIYMDFFVYISNHYFDVMKKIKKICKENNIRYVAFFGDFKISKVLKSLLKQSDIILDYIVCNWDNKTCEKVIPIDAEEYPKIDAIIICDVMANEQRVIFLKNKVSFKIYTIYDFINSGM